MCPAETWPVWAAAWVGVGVGGAAPHDAELAPCELERPLGLQTCIVTPRAVTEGVFPFAGSRAPWKCKHKVCPECEFLFPAHGSLRKPSGKIDTWVVSEHHSSVLLRSGMRPILRVFKDRTLCKNAQYPAWLGLPSGSTHPCRECHVRPLYYL